MLRLSLNPYGLTYTLGLQGLGTPRANPQPLGVSGFIRIVRDLGLRIIELDHRWLTPLDDDGLRRLREELGELETICSFWLAQRPGEDLQEAVRCCRGVDARVLRFHLTPVVEGARAEWGSRWADMMTHARGTLLRESARVADAGLVIAVEDHQDVGSEELLDLVGAMGPHAGICLDTGNPFAVGEDPVAFTRRVAARIYHVHLKDYRAQFTREGYRLVRCAIGDGAVPFAELATVLGGTGRPLAASIEPGALEARHVRLFTPEWWTGYPPREARELGTLLGRLRGAPLPEGDDYRTPWERQESGSVLIDYEMAQVRRSVETVRATGLFTS